MKLREQDILGVLPAANGWVAERIDETSQTKTTLPIEGWLVMRDGGLVALPQHVADEGWVVRPRTPSDDAAITSTANRMRTKANADWRAEQVWGGLR